MEQRARERIGGRYVVRIEHVLAMRRIVSAPTKRRRCRNSSRNDSVGALLQQRPHALQASR
ncbi:hypothetical protein WJ47_26670 [Burkholderia ubonensis]|uniref:Uncharacterized protein n=1 Tax=Burkholderia ubonensis TaxID=101571 RepID=A0AB73G1J1_9BURK|nr:hypothetical protein WJ44_13840 [Burkholderia ubonensis]KVL65755.1 hypothetical protein WJ49_32910 [Burkholderia ubonensis]KVL65986.1 hypothetical protein WJ48_17525 [Burkholderia ubonensis]KVL79416.1 hypothetical protein WJ47_26670 [Burkholderia ubonensis]KVL95940.1 hypothetical protein WJ50_05865 [Burkholderia ubonensis]